MKFSFSFLVCWKWANTLFFSFTEFFLEKLDEFTMEYVQLKRDSRQIHFTIKNKCRLCYNSSCSTAMLVFRRRRVFGLITRLESVMAAALSFELQSERKSWLSVLKVGLSWLRQLSFLPGLWRGRTAVTHMLAEVSRQICKIFILLSGSVFLDSILLVC